MLRSLRLLTLAFLVLFAACRGDDDDDNPAIDGGPDSNVVTGVTIQEVQNDAMVPGTAITLRGKVVTAIDSFGSRKGNFYIAEPGGGEFSGVLVFGAPVGEVALLVVGDLVDITGAEKDEFDGTGVLPTPLPLSITEVVKASGGEMTVTKVGTGTVPAPHALDALVVGQMATAAREAEYEKWEGVLVTVNNVSVTRGISPITSSSADDCEFREFVITGQLHVDSSLSAIPATLPMSAECPATTDPNLVASGDCVASITGMGDYFFSHKVLPRSTADIVTGGSGCPVPENTLALCGDSIDNDANGFTDCMDNGCRAFPACQMTTTVVNIQNGTIPVSTSVSLTNVIVTAVSRNMKNVWVADAATGAQFNGVAVFRGNNAATTVLPPEIVVGARVNVTGVVLEFSNGAGGTLTQIGTNPTVTFVPGVPALPTPVTNVPVATLATDATGEPYEGVLVEISNVRVTSAADSFGVRDFVAGTTLFLSDDDISVAPTEADGTCYALIRGVWSYNVFEDRWAILPLGGATNTMTGGTCTP